MPMPLERTVATSPVVVDHEGVRCVMSERIVVPRRSRCLGQRVDAPQHTEAERFDVVLEVLGEQLSEPIELPRVHEVAVQRD
jgi:hypothetical protein